MFNFAFDRMADMTIYQWRVFTQGIDVFSLVNFELLISFVSGLLFARGKVVAGHTLGHLETSSVTLKIINHGRSRKENDRSDQRAVSGSVVASKHTTAIDILND